MAKAEMSMKLLIDMGSKRVVFAETGKECVDFLFHLLSLPVATVIRLLSAERMGGSLPNLYKSLKNLHGDYIQPGQNRNAYQKPGSTCSIPLLALEPASASASASVKKKFYTCNYGSYCHSYVSEDPSATCPSCGGKMTSNANYVAAPTKQAAFKDSGLVKGVVTYMVMDDLEVKPMSTISSITLLNNFNIKDLGALEEKVVNLGIKEALKLLKASLQSKNVLTDVFC